MGPALQRGAATRLSVVRTPFGSEDLSMKEGGSRPDEPSGKVGNFVGAGEPAPGRAGGDSGLHFRGEVGAAKVGGHDHFDAGDHRSGGLPAPLGEDPFQGSDPGSGRKIASRTMVGEGGKEDKKDAVGSEVRTEVVDKPGDAVEGGEDLQGFVRRGVGAKEGRMGKKGKALERGRL